MEDKLLKTEINSYNINNLYSNSQSENTINTDIDTLIQNINLN